jgi:eukaryotic-like serine/threonine-protein kinase
VSKAPGDRIGRYIVDRRLGLGGMAEAWLAHQEGPAGFSKPVVVKVLQSTHAADPKMVELFLREARVGAGLNHTNLVQIFDLGEANGEYYIAMEYVDGLTLQQATRRCWALGTGIPIDIALRVIAGAALGLHHAHTRKGFDGDEAGIVHRDISPDNIMIARDGTVKVLDFGVSKLRGSEGTQTGELKGKIPFMSPEQLDGVDVDGRADLWALGVTLYWCCVGRRPFTAQSDVQVIRSILETEPAPPSTLNRVVTPEMEEVIMNLLEKDRGKRIATAAKLASRLQRLWPPSQGNPVARFIEKMSHFDDDPPELKAKTGSGSGVRGLPAAPPERDSTEIVARGPSAEADHGPGGTLELPRPAPVDPETTYADGDDDGPSTGNSGAQTVRLTRARRARRRLTAAAASVVVVAAAAAYLLAERRDPPGPAPALVREAAPSTSPAAAAVEDAPRDHPPPDEGSDPEADRADPAPEGAEIEPTAEESPTEDVPAARRPAELRSVVTVAPPHIRWTTLAGKPLGQGARALQVPEGDKHILAIDGRREARIVVPVAPRIAWEALAQCTLVVRVLPYATSVQLGAEDLGPTPLKAQSVVCGSSATYKVTIVKDKQREIRSVRVKPGAEAMLTVDLRGPK